MTMMMTRSSPTTASSHHGTHNGHRGSRRSRLPAADGDSRASRGPRKETAEDEDDAGALELASTHLARSFHGAFQSARRPTHRSAADQTGGG